MGVGRLSCRAVLAACIFPVPHRPARLAPPARRRTLPTPRPPSRFKQQRPLQASKAGAEVHHKRRCGGCVPDTHKGFLGAPRHAMRSMQPLAPAPHPRPGVLGRRPLLVWAIP